MKEEKTIPFSEVLEKIFTADPLPIQLLYRLSDLPEADFASFKARWPAVPDERRRVIMRHLADISEENFVVDFAPVFAFAFADPFAPVRVAALDGVWDATNISLIKPITRLMQDDESEGVRAAAAAALAHYVLLVEWEQLPARIAPPIVDALLAEYEKVETAVPVKRAALEALGAAHHPRVETLITEAYESANFEMQLSAVFAMGNSADTRWAGIVLDEMMNPSADMRAEAARAAGSIGGSEALDALADLVVDDDLMVAVAAVSALGAIGSQRAQEILAGILDDDDAEDLHEAAGEALEEMALLGGDISFDLLDIDDDEID